MIVIMNESVAVGAMLFWWASAGMFFLAHTLGSLKGTTWLALGCVLIAVAQTLEAMELPHNNEYWVGIVGVAWTGGTAACCYGIWQWSAGGRRKASSE